MPCNYRRPSLGVSHSHHPLVISVFFWGFEKYFICIRIIYYKHSENGKEDMSAKRIFILPRYTEKGPSSRVRFYQYIHYLIEAGFECDVQPFFDDGYIESLFQNKPHNFINILLAYIKRIIISLKSNQYSIIWMQYELLPWMPFWLEKIFLRNSIKLVIDYDDAVFNRYSKHRSLLVKRLLGKKIDQLMHLADLVITGNEYLAAHAQQAGAKKVEIIPSAVDTNRYQVRAEVKNKEKERRVGWIGSPTTVKYLLSIENVIKTITNDQTNLIIIGADLPSVFEGYSVESWPWSLETEVELIQKLDIGIMPLVDDTFERGKCGYKLIQYMACGLPVIASPVGINQKIIKHGENGFLASNEEEWIETIILLKENLKLRNEMGLKGRKMVEKKYALKVTAPRIINIFNQINNS